MAEVICDAPQSIENPSISEKAEASETLASEKETNGASKRGREEGEESKEENSKKPKVDDESEKKEEEEEEEVEMKEVEEEEKEKEEEKPVGAKLGPKEFESGEAMFNYFYKFLHYWPPNHDVNKYEHLALLELLKKGHAEPEKKIGAGIQAFQVRYHPMWKSRCFFLVRDDGTSDDFSFRKCVDSILPLPENMKPRPSEGGKKSGGHQKGGGGGGHGGGGRGGGHGGGGRRGRGGRGGFRK